MIPPPPPRSIELHHFYRNEPKRSSSSSEDPALSAREEMTTARGKLLEDNNYDFHISPLKEFAAPLASTAPSLMALADDSDPDDIAKAMRARSPIQEEPEPESELEDSGVSAATAVAYPFPPHLQPPTTKIDPIPIPPSRTPPSRQSSAMAISFTADHHWPSSGISNYKPREDVVMTSSRAPSPIRRHSSGPRPMTKESGSASFAREMSDLKRQDSMEMAPAPATTKDQLVSKLYDLLDSPRPSSTLHGHMLMQQQQQQQQQPHADLPEPTLPRPVSRLTTPSRPASTSLYGTSTTAHHLDDGGVAPDHRKPLVRASQVAMQLEKERMEKERRRLREASGLSFSNSLKDTTNVVVGPMDGHYLTRHRSIGGGGKPKVAPGPGPMLPHTSSYHAHAHPPAHAHVPAPAEAVM